MPMDRMLILPMVCLLFVLLSINSCRAAEEYSLQVKVSVSPLIPLMSFQSVSPILVSVELRNIGNTTFDGVLRINGKTEDGSYEPVEYNITNLTKDATWSNSCAYKADDIGTYRFTIEIEPNQVYSTIKLYQDSGLVDEGWEVQAANSIFYHSFSEFIAIIGIVIAAIVSIVVAVYMKRR